MIMIAYASQSSAAMPTAPVWTEVFSNATTVLQALSALISLILLVGGVAVIKELRLRGFDTLFGFYAMLKIHLKLLLKDLCVPYIEAGFDHNAFTICARKSVFFYLAERDIQNGIIKEANDDGNQSVITRRKFVVFKKHVEAVIELLHESERQIPLSESIWKRMDEINTIMLEVSYVHFERPLNSPKDVEDKHKALVKAIYEIINELNELTPKNLNKFWYDIKNADKCWLRRLLKF